jgi:hypothetical protein
MRRTQCAYLEKITIWRPPPPEFKCFGPVADVLMTGMATKLRTLACTNFGVEGLKELMKIIEAGVLPSLTEVEICELDFQMAGLTAMCDPRLNSLITVISVTFYPYAILGHPMRSLFQAIFDGSFPKLRALAIDSDVYLSVFVTMLQNRGPGGAQTLREVWIRGKKDVGLVHTLRGLLPAATIHITHKAERRW